MPWKRGETDAPESASEFEDSDDYLQPSATSERMPLYALLGASGLTVLLFLGIFLWMEFASGDISTELRMLRPHLEIKIPPPNRMAKDEPTKPSADSRAKRDSKEVRVPSAPDAKAAVLHPHPDKQLIESTDTGPLPMIAKDGRQPWRVYSRPFNALEKRPRVAVIITGLGISFNATESAVEQMPGEVTFAFAPFADKLKEWIDAARGAGHEVLLDLPMEPKGFPRNDPGPFGLLTSLQPDQNKRRMEWILSRMTGYVGVTSYGGDRFTGNKTAMQYTLSELKRRGLLFVDSMENHISTGPALAAELNLPFVRSSRIIDQVASRAAIGRQLTEIEGVAKAQGAAVVIARPYPVTLRVLRRWIPRLADKGLVLAPVSAVANRQERK